MWLVGIHRCDQWSQGVWPVNLWVWPVGTQINQGVVGGVNCSRPVVNGFDQSVVLRGSKRFLSGSQWDLSN